MLNSMLYGGPEKFDAKDNNQHYCRMSYKLKITVKERIWPEYQFVKTLTVL